VEVLAGRPITPEGEDRFGEDRTGDEGLSGYIVWEGEDGKGGLYKINMGERRGMD
jgi:hypothetical protein